MPSTQCYAGIRSGRPSSFSSLSEVQQQQFFVACQKQKEESKKSMFSYKSIKRHTDLKPCRRKDKSKEGGDRRNVPPGLGIRGPGVQVRRGFKARNPKMWSYGLNEWTFLLAGDIRQRGRDQEHDRAADRRSWTAGSKEEGSGGGASWGDRERREKIYRHGQDWGFGLDLWLWGWRPSQKKNRIHFLKILPKVVCIFSDNRHETKRLNEPLLFLTIDPHEQFFSFSYLDLCLKFALTLEVSNAAPWAATLNVRNYSFARSFHLQRRNLYNVNICNMFMKHVCQAQKQRGLQIRSSLQSSLKRRWSAKQTRLPKKKRQPVGRRSLIERDFWKLWQKNGFPELQVVNPLGRSFAQGQWRDAKGNCRRTGRAWRCEIFQRWAESDWRVQGESAPRPWRFTQRTPTASWAVFPLTMRSRWRPCSKTLPKREATSRRTSARHARTRSEMPTTAATAADGLNGSFFCFLWLSGRLLGQQSILMLFPDWKAGRMTFNASCLKQQAIGLHVSSYSVCIELTAWGLQMRCSNMLVCEGKELLNNLPS